jgi:hypothetical protein
MATKTFLLKFVKETGLEPTKFSWLRGSLAHISAEYSPKVAPPPEAADTGLPLQDPRGLAQGVQPAGRHLRQGLDPGEELVKYA